MKRFTIDFKMDSDAFADFPADEVLRILDNIIRDIEYNFPQADEDLSKVIQDINGNTIGVYTISY